jgi:hypothetical protein
MESTPERKDTIDNADYKESVRRMFWERNPKVQQEAVEVVLKFHEIKKDLEVKP